MCPTHAYGAPGCSSAFMEGSFPVVPRLQQKGGIGALPSEFGIVNGMLCMDTACKWSCSRSGFLKFLPVLGAQPSELEVGGTAKSTAVLLGRY